MAKQRIEIGLSFSADTNKAKGSLQQLEKQLNSFLNNSVTDLPLTKSISAAQEQAAKLSVALKQAVNIDTGKFDLSKFQSSLKKSNTDLKTLRDSFVKAGPEGTKTFMALAQSIVAAEVPAKRMNAGLEKMLKTLKDTARWQISSNIMHGLQGALQEAYGYAQDLNKSLNDIRIVTGYSTDQMENFAVSANKAAKALSTTTNEYTKASLIYFQQGLSDQEVTKRTQTTIKMANVTGEAAEDVSSYMTAVWNNFDDGSKKLEYYADAITALGAATASSSEEIATGLQKFSAVANTVGLSYEYATAALATVTSQTRESAETVGTAFKTIFARLESLSLGETLDDDTTMTKYSQALAQVGVNIKTANGDLKKMDTIIDELGGKWNSISKDQQIALAQTVAGMRQYNNFIALLDNYETMKLNVEIAADSEGTLDEQASIYAESWEAASDRVRAAAETIYEKILDDDFFIDLLNGFEKLLGLLDKFIDSAGGLQGILFGVSSILLKTFSGKAAEGLENMVYNFKEFFGLNKKEIVDYKEKVAELTKDLVSPQQYETKDWQTEKLGLQNKLEMQLRIADIQDNISTAALAELQTRKQIFDLTQDQSIELAKQAEQAQNEVTELGLFLKRSSGHGLNSRGEKTIQLDAKNLEEIAKKYSKNFKQEGEDAAIYELDDIADVYGISTDALIKYCQAYEKKLKLDEKNKEATKAVKNAQEDLTKKIEEAAKKKAIATYSERIVKLSQALTGVVSAISMVNGAINTLRDPDVSGWEKFTSILMTLGTLIPMITTIWNGFKEVKIGETLTTIGDSIATKVNTKLKEENADATKKQSDAGEENAETNLKEGATQQYENSQLKNDKIPKGGLKGGVGTALGVIGTYLAAFALIAGSIALYNNYLNKEKKALEDAREDLAEYSALTEKVRQNYEGLKSSISSLDEQYNNVKKMTKGTTEWNDAVSNLNDEALNLIYTYDQLAGRYQIINGVITFDEGALEDLQNEQLSILNTARRSEIQARSRFNQAENSYNSVELARNKLTDNGKSGEDWAQIGTGAGVGTGIGMAAGLTGGLIGVKLGATIGSAIPIPVVGTLLGALVGGIMGAAIGGIVSEVTNDADQSELDTLNKISELSKEQRDAIFASDSGSAARDKLSKLGIEVSDQLAQSLIDNAEETKKLVDELALNNERIKENNALAMQSYLQTKAPEDIKDIYNNSEYQDAIAYTLGNGDVYNKAKEEALKTLNDQNENDFWSWLTGKGWGGDDEELAKKYAEAQGWDWSKIKYEGGTDGATLTLEDGTIQKVDDADMIDFLASETAIAEAAKQIEELERIFEKTEAYGEKFAQSTKELSRSSSEAVGNAMANFLGKDKNAFNSLNMKSVEALQTQLESVDATEIISNEEAKAAGWETAEKYVEAMKEQLKNEQTSFTNALNELTSSYSVEAVEFLKNSTSPILQQLTRDQQIAYGTFLDNIQKYGGGEAQQIVNENVQSLLNNYGAYADQIVEIIGQLDWSEPDKALQQFEARVQELGIIIDTSAWSSEELGKSLKDLNISNALKYDLNDVRSTLSQISKIVNNLKLGDIITDEDFKTLTKLNGTMADAFMMTVDGYKYIGSAGTDLKTIQEEISRNQLNQGLLNNVNKRSAAARAQAAKWSSGETVDWESVANGLDANVLNAAKVIQTWDDEQLSALGTSSDTLMDLIRGGKVDELRNVMRQIQTTIVEAENGIIDQSDVALRQVYASTLTTFDQLNQAYLDGLLGYGDESVRIYKAQEEEIKKLQVELKALARDSLAQYYDFQLSRLEHEAFDAAKSIEKLSASIDNEIKNLEQYEQNIKNIGFKQGISQGENEDFDSYLARVLNSDKTKWDSNDIQELNTFLNGYISAAESIYDSNRKIVDTMVQYFDDILESYDKFADKAKQINNLVESYSNIVDIVGTGVFEGQKNAVQESLKTITKASQEAQKQNLYAARLTLDTLKTNREVLQDQYQTALREEEVIDQEYWDAQFEEIDSKIAQSQENFQQTWKEALQTTAEIYKQEIGEQIEQFSKDMTGAAKSSLSELSEVFERQSVLNEQYVADYKSIYELSKLTRNIEKSINDTASIKAKSQLRDLQAEITALQDSGKKLSEYDLELLQKRYELRQAEIAMEEAQNAKNTVRLTQDVSGNWGYVYTQNAEEVTSAAQTYEDKLYALQELGATYLEETGAKVIQIQSEFASAIEEIYNNQDLTTEERQKKIDEVTQFYTERLKFYTFEYDKTIANNAKLYEEDFTSYSIATGYKLEQDEKFATSFNKSVLGSLETGYKNAQDWFEAFVNKVGYSGEGGSGLLGALDIAYQSYADDVDDIFKKAGSSIDGYANDIKTTISGDDGKGGLIGELNGLFDILNTELTDASFGALASITTKLNNWWNDDIKGILDAYLNKIEEVKNASVDFPEDLPSTAEESYNQNNKDSLAWSNTLYGWDYDALKQYAINNNLTYQTEEGAIDINKDTTNKSHVYGAITQYTQGGASYGNVMDISKHVTQKQNSEVGKGDNIEKTLYSVEEIGTYDNGYAAVKLDNGKWYAATSFGGKTQTKAIGTLRFGDQTSPLTEERIDKKDKPDIDPPYEKGDLVQYNDYVGGVTTGAYWDENAQTFNAEFGTDPEMVLGTPLTGRKKEDVFGKIWWEAEFLKDQWLLQDDIVPYAFDTGGYTGQWGPEGRLAMLHQKEIVLNASDTSNLLASVSLIRDITKQIDLQAAAAASGLGSLAIRNFTDNAQTLQQDVTIHAEFPNVTNHNEIEQAFDTLINRAAQYTNRSF